ncbi:hypothetical protein KXV68_003454 [Aspergillus fumigatus]|nr:hypothetical protein KXX23_003571 [Aspergillus fumigatus]KAH1715852.1 hypothetical protein KXX40_003726 [Aspergillus fumigatus]KAH1725943.1 hypothetical protein KXX25_009385 [Aspergillus fumigatus]KAH1823214.1 hypothetical protein KXX35_009979 [Aspergillus fumigatus]KAH2086489.1 hypothetical protein KXW86_008608 [Aspergillus fumigatus]
MELVQNPIHGSGFDLLPGRVLENLLRIPFFAVARCEIPIDQTNAFFGSVQDSLCPLAMLRSLNRRNPLELPVKNILCHYYSATIPRVAISLGVALYQNAHTDHDLIACVVLFLILSSPDSRLISPTECKVRSMSAMAQDSQTTADLGPALVRGIWAAVIIAVIIVVLRVFAKVKIGQFRVDDVLMIVSLILVVVATVFLTQCVQHGFGKNLLLLVKEKPHDVQLVLKYIAIQVPIVTISTTIARCSFVLYLLAILGNNKKYQIALWTVMVLQFAGNVVSAVLPLSICRNVRILWDPTTKTTCGDVHAVIKFAYYSNTANSACDLFLAVFPTLIFWNLNLKMRIKISLIILLSLGILAMIASIIKTTKLNEVPSVTNLGASGAVELIRWGYVENAIIIITSSVPCIRPLIISSVRKFSSRGYSRSYELTGPATGQRRTGHDETAQSRRTRRFTKNGPPDTGSIERILDPVSNTNTSVSGRRDSPPHLDQGITKQVEISVISNDQLSRDHP